MRRCLAALMPLLILAGCTQAPPAGPPVTLNDGTTASESTPSPRDAPMVRPTDSPMPLRIAIPPFIGMPWPAAQSLAGSVGLLIQPTFTGPLNDLCRVVAQEPQAGAPSESQTVQVVVDCPAMPFFGPS